MLAKVNVLSSPPPATSGAGSNLARPPSETQHSHLANPKWTLFFEARDRRCRKLLRAAQTSIVVGVWAPAVVATWKGQLRSETMSVFVAKTNFRQTKVST